MNSNDEVQRESARRTRRSFLIAGVGVAGGYSLFRWIDRAPGDQLLPRPLRKGLNFNEAVSRALFHEHALTPTYNVNEARDLRVNGDYGLKQELVAESFRLQVVGVAGAETMPQYVKDVTAWEYQYKADAAVYERHDTKVAPKEEPAAKPMPPEFSKAFAEMKQAEGGKRERGLEEAGQSDSTLEPGTPGLLLKMADITRLNRTDLVTQFKCIEGWSEIVHWGGFRLADLIAAYPPARDAQGALPKYVYMETPNGDYYTGYELAECMHPQTLLVTEMAGRPLTAAHGAPLRLHMPIKYGYKQIKRIGLIAYTNDKPDDYWTKLGYDWYAGL